MEGSNTSSQTSRMETHIECTKQGIYEYRLQTDQHLHVGEIGDHFTTETILKLALVDRIDEDYVFDVTITSPLRVIDFQNYITEEVIKATQSLTSMYDHLVLRLNGSGELQEVLNRKEVWEKWQVLRRDLIARDPFQTLRLVELKDAEMEAEGKMEGAVLNSPPFQVLFNILGRRFTPFTQLSENRLRYDLINGSTVIPYTASVEKTIETDNDIQVRVTGELYQPGSNKPDIEDSLRKAMQVEGKTDYDMVYEGTYVVDHNGWLISAVLHVKDMLSDKHRSDIVYHLSRIESEEA